MQVSNNENVRFSYRLLLLCMVLLCATVSFGQQDVDEENPTEIQQKTWKSQEKLAKQREEKEKLKAKKDKESAKSKKLSTKKKGKIDHVTRKNDKTTGTYQGKINDTKNHEESVTDKNNANFDYSLNPNLPSLKHKQKTERQNNKEAANFNGGDSQRDLNEIEKTIRKKDKEIANSEGTITVKQVNDGLNTSKVYKVVADGTKSSYKKQQRIRKRVMRKHANKKDSENKPIIDKGKAPKYDPGEKNIWED